MKKGLSEKERVQKFGKTKEGKLAGMVFDVRGYKNSYKSFDKLMFLAAALSIITKRTRFEKDAKTFIDLICPEYFKEE